MELEFHNRNTEPIASDRTPVRRYAVRNFDTDIQYFRRRALQERQAADRADGPEARAIHGELARRYRRMGWPVPRVSPEAERLRRQDDLLDNALTGTFPASDPISVALS